ncbi:choice-of-anchor tandem repeat NxxGxxAF-containing protein [Nitrosomonas sp. Nm33]|uniref:DUF7453 family protein n=1 Tax=Nitrosomonas sp. Nm33 TaxID=133724 RepID=UPI0008962D01|nr:choice-of-anchor tandem repeat NxxGxxAF-containing protein [Nitrosomonas sp. Nm33]SDY94109.1 hypothetical protein SAMN05421755_10692 [Nitrosomonas sp. Nm33]
MRATSCRIILKIILLNVTILCSSYLFSAVHLIAESGQPAAGFTSEYTYRDLINPVIGSSGHVAFTGDATVAGNGGRGPIAVWSGLPGQLELIIKEYDSLPGFPYPNVSFDEKLVFFSRVSTIVVTESGHVGFLAKLQEFGIVGGQSTFGSFGLVTYVSGKIYGILRNGDQAPGFSQEYYIGGITNFAFTDAGMVIQAVVGNRNNNQSERMGIWFWNFETLELIPSPLANCDYIFLPNAISSVNINQSGEIAFSSGLGGALCPSETFGIFKWDQEKTQMILTSGDPVPGMADTTFHLDLDSRGLNIFAINVNILSFNDQGEISFPAILRNAANGSAKESLWIADSSGAIRLLLLEGEFLAEDVNSTFLLPFTETSLPLMGSNGSSIAPVKIGHSLAILAGTPRLSQPYVNINEGGVSQLSSILQLADQPPGFGDTWFFSSFSSIAMNKAGQFALSGAVVDANDASTDALGSPASQKYGIWRGTSKSDLELVAYDGMPVSVDGKEVSFDFAIGRSTNGTGGVATFSESQILHSSTEGGHATQLNDSGQIVFGGFLDAASGDFRRGIFLAEGKNNQEERIFALAEQVFPDLFSPENGVNQTAEGFLFRFYPATNTYLGIKNKTVFVAGERFGSGIIEVGPVENVIAFLEAQ